MKIAKTGALSMALSFLCGVSAVLPALANDGATFQGAVCGDTVSAEYTKITKNEPWTIDRKGTVFKCENKSDKDKSGFVWFLGKERNVLYKNKEHEMMFTTLDDDARNNAMVTFVFRPHPGSAETFSVDKPLKEFGPGTWSQFTLAKFQAGDLYKRADGIPDLRTVKLTLKGKGKLTFACWDMRFERGIDHPDINLKNGDCKLLEQ